MNIPARYVTGYMGDIGVPIVLPMDFSGWFEAYLGDRWHTFDARHNVPRIGRIVMAVGRDAADVAPNDEFRKCDAQEVLRHQRQDGRCVGLETLMPIVAPWYLVAGRNTGFQTVGSNGLPTRRINGRMPV